MAHLAEAKGHGGNRLMCSPQGVRLSLILWPFPDGLSQTGSSSAPPPPPPPTPRCARLGFQSHVQMKLLIIMCSTYSSLN